MTPQHPRVQVDQVPVAAARGEDRQDPLKEVLVIQAELAKPWQQPDPTRPSTPR